jgi:transposase InsO family protein
VSRSGLDRCLRRHGVSRLADLRPTVEGEKKPVKSFKPYAPGFVHVDLKYLPQMPDEQHRQYPRTSTGRRAGSTWRSCRARPPSTPAPFCSACSRPLRSKSKVLTDNGKEFTDRSSATGQRDPTGKHAFDRVCASSNIEHRLIKPRYPQTNGMVERFNGRIAEVVGESRFRSAKHLHETISDYVKVYNHHIPQRVLGHTALIDALKKWYAEQPDLFRKRPYNLTGLDT